RRRGLLRPRCAGPEDGRPRRPRTVLARARGRDRPDCGDSRPRHPRAARADAMTVRSFGTMGVDWEERVDFERLRRERLARAQQHLRDSDLGALLCFDTNNIRYITATHIGTWAIDKLVRFCLLPRD